MNAILLALGAAGAYGLSDFLGGAISRRSSAWPIALLACGGALVTTAGFALLLPGHPHPSDFAWAGLAGLGSGAATGLLYRGLSAGRMGVVAPVSAVGSALIPVLVGVMTGDRPTQLAWAGIMVALPGIWLVSREAPKPGAPVGSLAAGLGDGLAAGIGFGVLFSALAQQSATPGYWPLTVTQVTSVVSVTLLALLLGAPLRPSRGIELLGLVAGVLGALAVLCFWLAQKSGLLSVTAVLASLYPALTVMLALVLLRERIHRQQAVGIGLCAITVVCVALG